MKLYLENVRSFEGWHEIPIAPTTVLVGENSAGKSTLLGMLSVVFNDQFPLGGNLFNKFPFEFGSFKTIATSNKKLGTRFAIGFQSNDTPMFFRFNKENQTNVAPSGVVATYRDNAGLPVLCHVFAWAGEFAISVCEKASLDIERSKNLNLKPSVKVETIVVDLVEKSGLDWQTIRIAAYKKRDEQERIRKRKNDGQDEVADFLIHQLNSGYARFRGMQTFAFAPMRSRPKRTYDQLSEEFSPEGDHVPLLLARAADPDNKSSNELHTALQQFGRYSEMFSDIVVNKLGKGSGNPFQVQVKMKNKKPNIMDVGYGVSQILPLIVDAQRARRGSVLLFQQPEVHLHPKAQAALGSMFKDWATKDKKTVVAETHSDYLVDRLRLEVKRGALRPEDVQIYYLEKEGDASRIYPINIDATGNINDQPVGYRDFFLHEQMQLLTG